MTERRERFTTLTQNKEPIVLKLSRSFLVQEIARELYHNRALLEFVKGDHIVVELGSWEAFCHDLGIIFSRAACAAVKR